MKRGRTHRLLLDIDRLLRGGFTQPEDLRLGKLQIPVRSLLLAGILMGAFYGLFMGLYGGTRPGNPSYLQMIATTVKVPALFFLTLVVTLPSLYVSSALAGSHLRFADTVRLLLASIAISLALLASLGPVLGFFMLSSQSYPFLVLLNVLFFTISGLASVLFLRKALNVIFETQAAEGAVEKSPPASEGARGPKDVASGVDPDTPAKPTDPAPSKVVKRSSVVRNSKALIVMRVWILIYCVVGAQMGWILRPFIGAPDLPFQLFRPRHSSFFAAVIDAVVKLFG